MTCGSVLLLASVLAADPLQVATRRFVDAHVAAADPAVALERFVNYEANGPKDVFAVNPKFWLKDVDFSCVSPWNSAGGRLRAGVAVSRRHVVFAKHFHVAKGARILFTDGEIGVCPCRVADLRPVKGPDIMVGLLDVELTPNIRPAKILPDDYVKWMPVGSKWPVVTFSQREQVFLSEATRETHALRGTPEIVNGKSGSASWQKFGGCLVGGDSGNPAFLLVNGEPVFLYCLYTGGVGFGPKVHEYRKEVQAAMDALCPGYPLECYQFGKDDRR